MSTSSRGRFELNPELLLYIDQELESYEVSALCFLCRDVVGRKGLEKLQDGKELFFRLEERGLLENSQFLYELLATINRNALLNYLMKSNGLSYDTDATPILSNYRKMLYSIYDNCTQENFEKITFLLSKDLGRRAIEKCETLLDVFVEMERLSLLSNTNLELLYNLLLHADHGLAKTVQDYIQSIPLQTSTRRHILMDPREERESEIILETTEQSPAKLTGAITDERNDQEPVSVDAQPVVLRSSDVSNDAFYPLTHIPRGPCVIINNMNFRSLSRRRGTEKDEETLTELFTDLGFTVDVHRDLPGREMRNVLRRLSTQDFRDVDALVVVVLSHGENQVVYGSDEDPVSIKDLTHPFMSNHAQSLAGKPKLFFIQACQGNGFQEGVNVRVAPTEESVQLASDYIEEDAGPVLEETIPAHADFLVGMATVPEHRSFRRTSSGSVFIQELCKQLRISAEGPSNDNILSVLTRVNREISRQDFMRYKQMPEPKYTLTRDLVLKMVPPMS